MRDRIRNRLQQWGIATQAYFPAIHLQPYFAQYRSEIPMPLPNAESASDNCLAIPFSGQLTKREIEIVCKELVDVIAAESRTSFERSSIPISA